MNNQRRKAIDGLISSAEAIKSMVDDWQSRYDELVEELQGINEAAAQLKDDIENIRDEEQEYIDNLPESLQSSERAQNADNNVSQLEEAISKCEEFDEIDTDLGIPDLDEVVSALDSAKE